MVVRREGELGDVGAIDRPNRPWQFWEFLNYFLFDAIVNSLFIRKNSSIDLCNLCV